MNINKLKDEKIQNIKESIQASQFDIYIFNNEDIEILGNQNTIIIHTSNKENVGFDIKNIEIKTNKNKVYIRPLNEK